ncbi:hypothetical protein Acy02nite_84320 [Actinoplanes cyaneus]|uniref:Uncharacterized protein n=1 Tax=Actinoplanes cyaneus TaxID=52696 RepID=A0A919MGS6_9ACTN|nr:hypothetical protein [Actinoplanes cyaneus]MCW2143817.1 hypothetical protein [Actinoplanes cyaneus]GID70551.1 hypothetical protein Acy02nite_84320 [Actinoplanes cyaneus]
MTVARYAARTTAFAVVYLLVYWMADLYLILPPVVAAVWMLTQGHWGLRRFDVIALVTVTVAAAIAGGATMLSGFGRAAVITAPALLFAVLVERWLPGWWQGHGDRFRAWHVSLGKVAGAAAVSAVAFLVLFTTMFGVPALGFLGMPVVQTVAVLLVALAGRTMKRQATKRQRPGLTLVR